MRIGTKPQEDQNPGRMVVGMNVVSKGKRRRKRGEGGATSRIEAGREGRLSWLLSDAEPRVFDRVFQDSIPHATLDVL